MDNRNQNISPEMIAAWLSNQLSQPEAEAVRRWISASPENQRFFEQIKMVWEESGRLVPKPVDIDVDAAWNKMSMQVDIFDAKENKQNIRFLQPKTNFWRIAAVLIPLIAIASLFVVYMAKPKMLVQQSMAHIIKQNLADGSLVTLNKNSKLSYPEDFSGETREVKLEGEAFFEVKPDKTKPFIIHADDLQVKVLGTSFNVKALSGSNEIAVEVRTGRVQFYKVNAENDSVAIVLEAGDKGIYNKVTRQLQKSAQSYDNESFWKDKSLVFKKTELRQVLQTLQKCYNVTISVADESLLNLRFSSSFKEQPADTVIKVISATFDLKVKKEGENYRLETAN
jgi:transmembrane sensor